VIPEIVVLALASTVRPTSLAAVYTLVSHGTRRLLWVYILAGLAFSVAFGVVVVGVFHGVHLQSGTDRTKGIADIVGGVAILVFAAGAFSGRWSAGRTDETPRFGSRWGGHLEERLTTTTAALAGPLTHLPGIFYLVALNVIVAHNPLLPGGLVAVLVFDVIWFAVPLLALALSIVNPAAARRMITDVQQWTGRNARAIVLFAAVIVGAALVIRGLLTLD